MSNIETISHIPKESLNTEIRKNKLDLLKSTIVKKKETGNKPNRVEITTGVEIIEDGKLSFYVVKAGESVSSIRQKLAKTKKFAYLKSSEYDVPATGRNIHGFNTPNKDLIPGFFMPIPLKSSERKISGVDLYKNGEQAINELLSKDTIIEYGGVDYNIKTQLSERIKGKNRSKKKVIDFARAFARCETAIKHGDASFKNPKTLDQIGSVELHRREGGNYDCYSFSYFHILMNRPSTGGSEGFSARKGLGLTEGDTYNPKNAVKLFLTYWILKTGGKAEKFNPESDDSMKKAAVKFNGGGKGYSTKFLKNFKFYKAQ